MAAHIKSQFPVVLNYSSTNILILITERKQGKKKGREGEREKGENTI